jgi:hypothetical protein
MTSKEWLNSGCEVPAPSSTFSTADERVALWFNIADAKQGDIARAAWIGPDGEVAFRGQWAPLDADGNWCLRAFRSVAGTALSSKPGRWTVKVTWNDVPLFDLTFTMERPDGAGETQSGLAAARADTGVLALETSQQFAGPPIDTARPTSIMQPGVRPSGAGAVFTGPDTLPAAPEHNIGLPASGRAKR